MKIELIPVLKIYYANLPFRHAEHYTPENRNKVQAASLKKAGFTADMQPYLSDTDLYRLVGLSDENLTRLVLDHIQKYRERAYEKSRTYPLLGGYVLRLDGRDQFFPQYNGDLSDIHFWKHLAAGRLTASNGQPVPGIHFEKDNVVFTFDEETEYYQPLEAESILKFSRSGLKFAVDGVYETLLVFQERIEQINIIENLDIKNIHELLIWGYQ